MGQKHNCDKCHVPLEGKWKSSFHMEKHYKIVTCDKCDYENRRDAEFEGSGDDNSMEEGESTIESIVKKVMEG